jgi:hypothetical protein
LAAVLIALGLVEISSLGCGLLGLGFSRVTSAGGSPSKDSFGCSVKAESGVAITVGGFCLFLDLPKRLCNHVSYPCDAQ